jgi:mannonate dehydratase
MRQTWRWFGPTDKVTLWDIRQAGAEGIVTSLYHIAPGQVWTRAEIRKRIKEVEFHEDGTPSSLTLDVIESIPVSEAIKTASPEREAHIAAWIESLRNCAAEGIKVICYNFMPVLDWTRTDLKHRRPNGALALRFDLPDFAAFDIYVLAREGAARDYAPDVVAEAAARAATWDDKARDKLAGNILAGLPGSAERWTFDSFRARLATYDGITAESLRANMAWFLSRVVPVAEELGVRLCCHADDPPWALFGLPRIMSTEADYRWLVDAVPSPANGITFCTGSLGARGDNDLAGMVQRLGPHIHFLHLRNVRREGDTVPCSFFEDDHLAGSTDMVAVIRAVVSEQNRRRAEGRADWQIPMRPDHGQEILTDAERVGAPGYPAVGRLKGLAELRGAMLALQAVA